MAAGRKGGTYRLAASGTLPFPPSAAIAISAGHSFGGRRRPEQDAHERLANGQRDAGRIPAIAITHAARRTSGGHSGTEHRPRPTFRVRLADAVAGCQPPALPVRL